MTTDVRTLLHDTAEVPSRGPDIVGAMQHAREHRSRRRGLGAVAAVMVLLFVGGFFVATSGGGDHHRVAIGTRQAGSAAPDGWRRVIVTSGVTVALPPTWNLGDFGETAAAQRLFSAGTSTPTDTSVMSACTSDGQLPTVPGSWLSVWEYPASAVRSGFVLPDGMQFLPGSAAVVERPDDFRRAAPLSGRCPFVGDAESGSLGASFEVYVFVDAERVFVARSVVAYPVVQAPDTEAAPRLLEAREILNTLHLAAPEGTSATIAPVPTTTTGLSAPPLPVATTTPPFAAATEDEQLIQQLFESWLRNHPDDDTRLMVEDADALMESIHEGLAQHTPEHLALYSGTVSGIRMLDPDHAEVRYTLLHGGVPQFGLRTGTAVRIDGRWMVSRATECALLSLGGITCPPPT